MDLADLGATQLVQMIESGEITSLELVEACIARIDSNEEAVGAWTHLDHDFAREQAKNLDKLRATGAPCGPLHGIPVGIKDIFDTDDFPTENGTVISAGRLPDKDCTVVSLLKAAGAVIMGKTVTTELAVYAPGKTRNPHDPERTPGGSSSGSAAAVATGMVPLAVGTQTNGSIIRPASFCGVVGFKPTHGRISRAGILALSRILDHVGVFARSLEDAALIAECLMVHDPADPDTKPAAAPRLSEISQQEPPFEPKFAFVRSPVWDKAEPGAQAAFEELHEFLGDNCDEVALPAEFDAAVGNLENIMNADLASFLSGYMKRGEDQLSDILRGMIAEGKDVSALDYNNSVDQIPPLRAWVQTLCEEYDAILTPATCGEAPLGLEATGDPVFCTTWTYLGVPAVTIPLMEGENGMPIGVQLVGPRGDDARLLRTARWLVNKVADDA
ncbi:MAG: amidase [Alphaproteobacteria bacterium]|jgi:Asp-tRNA(Asn)/Glu-tRNA(Gln) amidotransferase A subunit family amidase|nr:amidase [Alphaproteobacteria bacterium]